jgi:hypothetical protein
MLDIFQSCECICGIEPCSDETNLIDCPFFVCLFCCRDVYLNPPSDGFDAILVALDKLSKSMVLIPTMTTVIARETARIYFDKAYCRHGLARKIISDKDVRFTGAIWQELHKLLQVRLHPSALKRTIKQSERTAPWKRR